MISQGGPNTGLNNLDKGVAQSPLFRIGAAYLEGYQREKRITRTPTEEKSLRTSQVTNQRRHGREKGDLNVDAKRAKGKRGHSQKDRSRT